MTNSFYSVCDRRAFPVNTGVYKITFLNSLSNKIYVGSASSKRLFSRSMGFKSRWNRHIQDLRKSVHHSITLQRAYDKYGEENMVFSILELVDPMQCLIIEQKYIDLLDSCNNGYNTTSYAKSIINISNTSKYEEKIKKLYIEKNSELLNTLENLYKTNKSVKSLSQIMNLNKTTIYYMLRVLGIYYKITRKEVYQYDLNGIFLKKWDNARQCRKNLNVTLDSIRRVLIGEGIQSLGYFFSYDNLTPEQVVCEYNNRLSNAKIKKSNSAKKRATFERMQKVSLSCNKQKKCIKNIIQYDLSNNFIKMWRDSSEIEKEFDKKYKQGVLRCIKGRQKTHKGYKWVIDDIQQFPAHEE